MAIGIRSRLTSGFAVVSVGALVMTSVVAGPAAQAPAQALPPAAIMLAAATQPANPLVQQVGLHHRIRRGLPHDRRGALARGFAIPGALLQDIHNGVPVPAAVGRALQTFAQIELEAGRDLVGFAAEYVSFQLKFFANLVTLPVAAVGTLLSVLAPASATQAAVASVGLDDVSATRR